MLEIPVSVKSEIKTPLKGILKLTREYNETTLYFFPNANAESVLYCHVPDCLVCIPESAHQISEFSRITINIGKNIEMQLSGKFSTFNCFLANDELLNNFLQFIKEDVTFRVDVKNPNSYELVKKGTKTEHLKLFCNPLMKVDSIPLYRIDNYFNKPTSEEKRSELKKEEFENLFDEKGAIKDEESLKKLTFNCNIDKEIYSDVIHHLLYKEESKMSSEERFAKSEERLKKYQKTKTNWSAITKTQWENAPEIRETVAMIEKDIENYSELFERFNNKENAKQIVFDIFMTLSTYNWDLYRYTEGMIVFVVPFLTIYIKDIEDEVILLNNEAVSREECESHILWEMYAFFENNCIKNLIKPTNDPQIFRVFNNVYNLLDKDFPNMLQLLLQKEMTSLSFVINDLKTWYYNEWNGDDLLKLWTSAISTEKFFEKFIISSLYSLCQIIVNKEIETYDEFCNEYRNMIKSADLNFLLENVNKIKCE